LAGHLTLPGNCSTIAVNYTDAERMEAIEGYLMVMNQAAAALNANDMVPIFSIEAMFDPVKSKKRNFPYDAARGRQFTELGMVEALENVTWMRGYEFFQAYGWSEGIGESVANMINETAHGVPVVAHAYGAPNNCSDPQDKGIGIAVAAFLMAQGPYTYFQTSSSVVGADPWTDDGWCWHPLYNLKCGHPKANAVQSAPGVWKREFANCTVTLDQGSAHYTISQNGELVASSEGMGSDTDTGLPSAAEHSRPVATRAVKTDDDRALGYNSSLSPFYADPVFDGAHDAELVWHADEQVWWVVYLQNRYNSNLADHIGWSPCGPLCSYTDLGMASTPDKGKTWVYRGVAQGLDIPVADRLDPPFTEGSTQMYGAATWWRPCVYYDERTALYHGFFVYWSIAVPYPKTSLVHYTSSNVSHWKFEGFVRRNKKGYDSAVTRLSSGKYLLVSVGGDALESDDLYTWRPSNNSVGHVDEGAHFSRFSNSLWLNVEPRCGPPATPDWRPSQGRNCNPNIRKSTDGGASWQTQTQLLFNGPGVRRFDEYWAFQGPLVPQGDDLYVMYFTQLTVNTSLEPGVHTQRSMLQVAKVTQQHDGVVTADRNASFHWVMAPPDDANRDRGPVRAPIAVAPLAIAAAEAVVIAASELERWRPFWMSGGAPPTISNTTAAGAHAGARVPTTQLLFRDPLSVRRKFTTVMSSGAAAETRWLLVLDTGFGQQYRFQLAGNGTIEMMWNETGGAHTQVSPLRQFMRRDPGPGE